MTKDNTNVLNGACDSLCAEALAYAGNLIGAGVEVWAKRFDGVGHGFTMRGMGHHADPDSTVGKAAREAHAMMDAFLKFHLMRH